MIHEITMLLGSIWLQFQHIGQYWALGLVAGSLVSVFLSEKVAKRMVALASGSFWLLPLCIAAALGIVSPLCMYGTVPIIAAFGRKGVPQHLLAAFMISSILLNPNIFFFTFALGANIALMRLALCFMSGVLAGSLVLLFFRNKALFSLERFAQAECKQKKTFFLDLFKAFRITAPYLLIGITLAAWFERYVPPELIAGMFGAKRGLGVLFATVISIPLYVCGGGTIPLVRAWMHTGMGTGDAMAFLLAGPAVKINNLSAVKMILGGKHFMLYLVYNIVFAILVGWAIEFFLSRM
ncbi:MAG: permease [Spirochaetaceae bacterium]|nr:permease [Spirochaetaceae bacterium]